MRVKDREYLKEKEQKLKEEERQIYLEMMLKVDNLFILIKNPCMEQSLMKTQKFYIISQIQLQTLLKQISKP